MVSANEGNNRGRWEMLNFVAGDSVELESVNLVFPIASGSALGAIEQLYKGIIFTDSEEIQDAR